MKIGPALALVLAVASGCYKSQPAASNPELEDRVRKLEQYIAKNSEAIEFLSKVWEQQKQQAAAAEEEEPAPDAVFAVPIAEDVKAGLVEGPATAPVTIVKAFDFACPYCMRSSPIVGELVKEYAGKLRVVYKNLVIHPDTAMPGHLASCAAAKQGKYVAFKNAFWDKAFGPYMQSSGRDRASMEAANLVAIARELGLDSARFKADMDGAACKALIDGDMAELAKFKVSGTPAFFVNGKLIVGGMSKEELRAIVDAQLAVVQASGVPAAQYYDREVLGKGEKAFRSKKDARSN
ncbi:MAG: DsbA family protein [Kofleriaceae bacterium]